MKGIRPAVIVGVLALIALSWYSLYSESEAKHNEYLTNLNEARAKAEIGIYIDANHSYDVALSLVESLELRSEITDYYKASGQNDAFIDACSDIIQKYPKDETGYVKLIEYFYEKESYDSCYVFINKAAKRYIQSEEIDKIHNDIYYTYKTERIKLNQVGSLFDGLYLVQNENSQWGYYSEYGGMAIRCLYKQATPFSYEEFAWVYDQEDKHYLINKNNEKKYVDVEGKPIEECSALSSGLMAAKINGRYTYVNVNFEKIFGDYEYAGAFHNGMAAVKDKDGWYFINPAGERLSNKTYMDVKLDEAQKAFRNSLAFVSEDGKGYYLTNGVGEQIDKKVWEDAYPFVGFDPTAVKLDGKWGYLDREGKVVVEPKYEDARPFSNGLAPVKIDGKWGYIDSINYKLVIPTEFEEAKDMSSNGFTFIKQDNEWYRLSLYRFNYN